MAVLEQQVEGGEQSKRVELTGTELVLGRAEACEVVLEDKAVSRRHALIRLQEGAWTLVDNNSANGTYVNGRKVTEHRLNDGDQIRLGATIFSFSNPEAEGEEATRFVNAQDLVKQAELARTTTTPVRAATPSPAPAPSPGPQAAPPPTPPAAPAPPPAAAAAPRTPASPPPPSPPPQPASPPPMASPPPPVARPASSPAIATSSAAARPAAGASAGEYAGFWIRVAAYLIDAVIIGVAMMVITLPLGFIAGMLGQRSPGLAMVIMALTWLIATVAGLGYVLYFWATQGATIGKKVLGLRILRDDGVEPMGWGKAGLRLLGYMASGFILYIGFIMVAFMDRKKGLHDMIAGTVVVKTR